MKCQLSILHGLEVEPTKGETCSINGGPSILENGEENACFKEGLYSTSNIRLPRREAIAVGHEQEIQLDEGRNLQLTTLSMKPPIFEIADFLSDQECDHLVKLAKRNGFEKSTVPKAATVTREGVNETLTNNQMQIICRRIIRFDSNKDGKVSLNEFAGYAYRMTKMLVDINELLTVYKTLLPEEAEVFTLENCTKLNRTNFVEFVYRLFNMNRLPYFSVRYSEHSWIDLDDRDPILNRIKSRIAKVSQMSVSHIEHSENLQVVNYQRDGHYHAHYDSSVGDDIADKRCCSKYEDKKHSPCLLCRYITILFYLNNVTKGGETAFPIADREDQLLAQNFSKDLSKHCEKASLVVKPVKGRALFWYNNVLDEESGKMGEVEKLSLHGGCHVIDGEKWVANMWINAPRVDETV